MWEGNMATSVSGSGTLGQWLTNEGLFSFDPNALRGLIVNSASGASTTNTTGALHQKLDKTGFSYINRSYGLGSAAGLVDIPGTKDLQWYSYTEPGFVSEYSCINNASSAYVLEELPVPQGWELAVYQAEGEYPNGVETGGWIYAGYAPADIFSWGATYSNQSRSSYMSMATPANQSDDAWSFADFNNVQCQINFSAKNFHVLVNYTSKLISVTPISGIPWPTFGDAVMDEVALWLWAMSYTDGSFGGSQLGRSLRVNVNQLQNATGDYSNVTKLKGVADFVASCVDDVFVALGSVRYVAANQSAPVEASVGLPAVVFGDTTYIYGVLALNLVVCLVYLLELARTRAWEDTSTLDFMDLPGVIIACLKGGISTTGGSYEILSSPGNDEAATGIHGGLEPAVDHIRLRLGEKTSVFPSLVPVHDIKT
jgi:hypothetical protein